MAEKTESVSGSFRPDISDLLPAYFERRAGDLLVLRNSIQSLDFETIRNIGHKLSGNGSMFGFDQISKAGRDLEAAAIDKSISRIQEHTRELVELLGAIEVSDPGVQNETSRT